MDLVLAVVALAGIFLALKMFQVPNCTAIGREHLLVWARDASIGLAASCVFELLIGAREDSMLSKGIGFSCGFAAMLLWLIYTWKANAFQHWLADARAVLSSRRLFGASA